MRVGGKFKRKEKKMNPALLVPVIGEIASRFLDKKKPVGLTNLTTVGGGGVLYLGYSLSQMDDEPTKWVGVALMVAGAAIALIKEYKK